MGKISFVMIDWLDSPLAAAPQAQVGMYYVLLYLPLSLSLSLELVSTYVRREICCRYL